MIEAGKIQRREFPACALLGSSEWRTYARRELFQTRGLEVMGGNGQLGGSTHAARNHGISNMVMLCRVGSMHSGTRRTRRMDISGGGGEPRPSHPAAHRHTPIPRPRPKLGGRLKGSGRHMSSRQAISSMDWTEAQSRAKAWAASRMDTGRW
jgi:hypothetical protein